MRSSGTFSFNFLTMQMQTPTIPATTPVSPMRRASTLSGAGVAALTQSLSRPPSGLRRALSDAPHRPPPEPDVEASACCARASGCAVALTTNCAVGVLATWVASVDAQAARDHVGGRRGEPRHQPCPGQRRPRGACYVSAHAAALGLRVGRPPARARGRAECNPRQRRQRCERRGGYTRAVRLTSGPLQGGTPATSPRRRQTVDTSVIRAIRTTTHAIESKFRKQVPCIAARQGVCVRAEFRGLRWKTR
jgi:hypothetical protein